MIIAQVEFFHIGSHHGLKTVLRIADDSERLLSFARESRSLASKGQSIDNRLVRLNGESGLRPKMLRFILNEYSRYIARRQVALYFRALEHAKHEVERALHSREPIGFECDDYTYRIASDEERAQYKRAHVEAEGLWIFCFKADTLCSTQKLESLGYVM